MTTLALIGVGKWGKNYLTTAEKLPNVQIKYLCAHTTDELEPYKSRYIVTTEVNDLFDFKDIDAVILATPAGTHFTIAKELLKKGYNLLIEKPLTTNLDQAKQLLEIWQHQPSTVLVGHLQLFNPAYQCAKNLLPAVGNVNKVTFKALQSPVRQDTSILWDWGPHPASVCLDLFPETGDVAAEGGEGWLKFVIKYPQSRTFNSETRWVAETKVRELIIEGEKGRIELDDTNLNNQKVKLCLNGQSESFPKYDNLSPLTSELIYFTRQIEENKVNDTITSRSDLSFGLKVVSLLTAIYSTIYKTNI